MNLWYIAISLDHRSFNSDYDSEFGYHTSFISNYLSKAIRKVRFKTDGTFRMISIHLWPKSIEDVSLDADVIKVMLPFDRDRYERIKGTADYSYYLEMLEEGFRKAAEFKKIPLETLLNLIDEFRRNGCRNEWLHKKKRFREADLEVALNCYFTTLDFKLVVTIRKISTREELCSGTILRTLPDEIFFEGRFKDILIENGKIVITDFLDGPHILIDLEKALNKQLVSEILSRFGYNGLLPLA